MGTNKSFEIESNIIYDTPRNTMITIIMPKRAKMVQSSGHNKRDPYIYPIAAKLENSAAVQLVGGGVAVCALSRSTR